MQCQKCMNAGTIHPEVAFSRGNCILKQQTNISVVMYNVQVTFLGDRKRLK